MISDRSNGVFLKLCVLLNSANTMTKIFIIPVKGFEPATCFVRNQDATTVPARHM